MEVVLFRLPTFDFAIKDFNKKKKLFKIFNKKKWADFHKHLLLVMAAEIVIKMAQIK